MLALRIPDTRDFMKKLLTETVFDSFVVSEASVTTFTVIRIDGSWHPEYFGDGEMDPENEENENGKSFHPSALSWGLLRPVFFGLIRGRRTPGAFRLVFRLAGYNVASLLSGSGLNFRPEEVAGLFLNISFSNGEVSCTTGTSMNTFTLDQTLNHLWDEMVQKFLRQQKIPFTVQ